MTNLCTPQDWANIKRMQAMDVLGSPEAADLLADAKKFDECHKRIRELENQVEASKRTVERRNLIQAICLPKDHYYDARN